MDGSASSGSSRKPPTGVVFLNLGGPETVDKVYPFLHRLFSDEDLIPIPFQKHLAPWIAKRRTPSIQNQYQQIGGGSPIRYYSEHVAGELCKRLDKVSPETAPHKPYLMFRYSEPLTSETLTTMRRDGVRRAIAFSQYPQYSCSTTGSSLNELHRDLKVFDPDNEIEWSVIDRWYNADGLAHLLAERIREQLRNIPGAMDHAVYAANASTPSPFHTQPPTTSADHRDDPVLLFSAHSLPMSVVNRGDPYPAEVAATVDAVMKQLNYAYPYRLVWQSKVGPSAWLGCQTEEALEGFHKNGYHNVVVVPVAFTSDHVETLYELDIEYGGLCDKIGMNYYRTESFNEDTRFVDVLENLVTEHLKKGFRTSRQMLLQCPKCTNPKCGPTKHFFGGFE
eukprot:Nk52_evm10s271 gene=Nk52_evmTU10s271